MKTAFFAFTLLSFSASLSAEDLPMEGGRSPDKRYEVRISHEVDSNPSDYAIHVCTIADGKSIYTLADVSAYLHYLPAVDFCLASWHSSSRYVAVRNQDARDSVALYVFAVDGNRVERLRLPDYVQNILGRVDAVGADHLCNSTVKRWEGDDLVINLFLAIKGHGYTSEVCLHLSHAEHTTPTFFP